MPPTNTAVGIGLMHVVSMLVTLGGGLLGVVRALSAPTTCAIIGGGPAGMATAIMLARRGTSDIHVYEVHTVDGFTNAS